MRLLTLLICLATPVAAQSPNWGQWFSGPSEFHTFSAGVSEIQDGTLQTMEVLCAADVPYVSVAFSTRLEAERDATATLRIDGQRFDLPAQYRDSGDSASWRMVMERDLVAALSAGRLAFVQVQGQSGQFRLRGAEAAIAGSLQGCGQGAGYHPRWTDYADFAAASASDPVVRSGGGGQMIRFSALLDKARDACQSEPGLEGEAVITGDFDGDGQRDILFLWERVRCTNAPSAVSAIGAGFCGMHNCSVDVYLSSVYQPGGWPQALLSHTGIPIEVFDIGGRPALRTFYAGGDCAFANVCDRVWQFDGVKLSPVD